MSDAAAEGGVIWRPGREYIESSNIYRFMQAHGIATHEELLARAAQPEWFWPALVDAMGITWQQPYTQVLDVSRGAPWARWFIGGKLNLADYCLDRHARGASRAKAALFWEGEDGVRRTLTYGELEQEANRMAGALQRLGIGYGDRVGLYLPMVPETVAAVMALAKLGAIFTPIFSGYGAPAIASRLQDCEAKALITADGYYRRGQVVPMKQIADEAVAQSPSVAHVITVRRIGHTVNMQPGRDHWWHELAAAESDQFVTRVMDAEDPFMIIHTSGTTGKPKGAVHTHCGFPLKAAQDIWMCFDLKPDDTMFWITDLGWMMGPWLILGVMALGATMVLYEGTPDYPQPDRVWELVNRYTVNVLGISPTLIRSLMAQGTAWVQAHDLSSLRILGGTGEPWNPAPYRWFFEHAGGGRCPIINYTGGTEISGGILGCFPTLPLKPCSFAGPIPGMVADVYDEQGKPVRSQVGELVLTAPWPGMTRGFWQNAERYQETYWSRWENVWVHGDWARVDADGYWYIEGRSDDTIKVAGKRVGPAEIESALVAHAAVQEAAAIGVPHPLKGEAVVGFVVLQTGYSPSEALRTELSDAVVSVLGKPMRPETIRFVSAIPKTRNAKVLRRVIRAKYLGLPNLGDLSSLENPDTLEAIGQAQ